MRPGTMAQALPLYSLVRQNLEPECGILLHGFPQAGGGGYGYGPACRSVLQPSRPFLFAGSAGGGKLSVLPGFHLYRAYRWTDAKTNYNGELMEKPLTSKYKGLLTASYQTPLGLWQFDVTLQLNGGGRMPAPYELENGGWSWERRYGGFEQLSAR